MAWIIKKQDYGELKEYEQYYSDAIPRRAFKHYELVEAAKLEGHCKVCGKVIHWKRTSFSNLTCSPKCRKIYKQRQSMSMCI